MACVSTLLVGLSQAIFVSTISEFIGSGAYIGDTKLGLSKRSTDLRTNFLHVATSTFLSGNFTCWGACRLIHNVLSESLCKR